MLTADDRSSNIIFLFHLVQIVWVSVEEIPLLLFLLNIEILLEWNLNLVIPKEAAFCNGKTFVTGHRGVSIKFHNIKVTYSPADSYSSQSWGDKTMACVCLRFQYGRDSACPHSHFSVFDRRCRAPQRWQWEAVPERSSPPQPSFTIKKRYWLLHSPSVPSCMVASCC